MNPLPWYLFANGLFSVRQADKNGNETIYGFGDWGVDEGELCLFGRDQMGEIKSVTYPLISQCQLIARKIEDMTDEEIVPFTLSPKASKDGVKQSLIYRANEERLYFHQAKRLLGIGVYPGPQSHFGDTVIDTRTLTNA